MDDWDPAAIARARGIAFVAPQKPFTRGEVEELLQAEEDGAVVILTTGQPDSAGSRPLLEAHGLALVPQADGNGHARRPDREPARARAAASVPRRLADRRHRRAATRPTLPGVEVIYRQGEDVLSPCSGTSAREACC